MMILILIVAILLLDQSVAFIFPNLLRNCARLHSNRQEASTSLDAPISSSSSLSSVTGARDKGMSAINRADFPILDQDAYEGKPLIYLDSAASSQKPTSVINAMNEYYLTTHSNVHRGAHALASRATTQYEWAREQLQSFINAKHREEVIFVRGATEAINLVALSWGNANIQEGDEIILSVMEHHSNLVPWQMLAQQKGAVLKFVQLDTDQRLDLAHYASLLSDRTKLVALQHASNVLGTCNPVKEIIQMAKEKGATVLLDACQSVPHMPVDVQDLGVDFLVASGHKMCGPTGIGFLYGKKALLEVMPPVQGGGEMIDRVELQTSTYAAPPSRFEAGTPAIAEAIGLGHACAYLQEIGMENVLKHEIDLGTYLYDQLAQIDDLTLYGPAPSEGAMGETSGSAPLDLQQLRTGLVAFNSNSVHATDVSFFLDQEGVAVRTGHHCTQPLHTLLGAAGSLRASLYFYNSKEDVDVFVSKLKEVLKMFEDMEGAEGIF